MTGTSRPWWASDDPSALLDDADPIEAFRAARRNGEAAEQGARPQRHGGSGSRPGAAGRDADPDPGVGEEAGPAAGGEPVEGSAAPHRPELCGICPLCSLARSLEETRPELIEHLTEAARHLAAAARALMEPPGDGPGPAPAADRLQRIDLDRDGPDRTASDHGGGS